MRPAGEIRKALADALQAGPGTTRQVAQRACTGLEATRRTLDNMVRAEQAQKLAPCKVPGVRRPVPRYALAPAAPKPAPTVPQLQLLWHAMA